MPTIDGADIDALALIYIVAGMAILVACDLNAFLDHIERTFIARTRRLAPSWFVVLVVLVAIVIWPAIIVVMAKAQASRRHHR
ncbi:MAG TPA: hypothetical protein VEU47_11100 [Candidatus Cybelea sp.]|nr:hypothetical protein [Candidatus Cybelea sp.]